MIICRKITGKYLNKKQQERITSIWEVFGPDDSKDSHSYKRDIFFLVYKNKKIVAAGRLQPRKVRFNNKSYSVLGIADIASEEKGKGYGRVLMEKLRNYLVKNNETGVGFCAARNSGFYQKMNFTTDRELFKRFYSKNHEDKEDDFIFFLEGKTKLISDMLKIRGEAEIDWFW